MSFQLRLEEPIELMQWLWSCWGTFSLEIAFQAKEQGMWIWL